MPTERRRRACGRSLALWMGWLWVAAADAAHACPIGTQSIDVTLATGSRWELCWEDRAEEGIVFHDVAFTPPAHTRRVLLKEANLAQLQLVADDDSARRLLPTEAGAGLGGSSRVGLQPGDCPGGTLLSAGGIDALCQREAGRGYSWKSYEELEQGYWLELTALSRIGELAFFVRHRFYDDGTIALALGSSGRVESLGVDPARGTELASTAQIGIGFVTNAWWRLDFDIGANAADDKVERFEVLSSPDATERSLAITPMTTEFGEHVHPLRKRSWRILDGSTQNADGHPISIHFEPIEAADHYAAPASEPWADPDFAVTRLDACERLVAENDTTGGCGADLDVFLSDAESIDGGDVVVWARATRHHYPRDEDAPFIATRWQELRFVLRDWTAENPLSTGVGGGGGP